MIAYSGSRQRAAASMFYDFKTVFSSLARRWFLVVLRGTRLPEGVIRVVAAL